MPSDFGCHGVVFQCKLPAHLLIASYFLLSSLLFDRCECKFLGSVHPYVFLWDCIPTKYSKLFNFYLHCLPNGFERHTSALPSKVNILKFMPPKSKSSVMK